MKHKKVRQNNPPQKEKKAVVEKKSGIGVLLIVALAVALMGITWFLYQPSLQNNFTNWDDPDYVLDNPHIKQLNPENIKYLFSHQSAGNYHPLTMISLGMDYERTVSDVKPLRETDELEAAVFHRTNVILHVLNVLLVFIFIFMLSGRRLIAATVTALLFAIHPLHVESVAWVAERKDVLYTFFFLAGLIIYLWRLEKKAWWKLPLTGVLFFGSLLSKPAAVVFPLVLLAIDFFKGRKFTRAVIVEKAPFFLLSLLFGIITLKIQSSVAAADIGVFSMFQRVAFAAYGFVMYHRLLLLPLGITSFYPIPNLTASGGLPIWYCLAPVAMLAIIALVIWSLRYNKIVSFGYLFFFFCIILVLQFMPVGRAIMDNRYSYLSSVGLFFIIGWLLDRVFLSQSKRLKLGKWALASALIAYVFFLGSLTIQQLKIWFNSETLWTDVISKDPMAATAYKNRSRYYGDTNQIDKALQDCMSFIQLRQDDAGVYSNLGNIYTVRGEIDKAFDAYSKSIALEGSNPKTLINRAIAYAKIKMYYNAIEDYNKALALSPGMIEVVKNRASTYFEMANWEKAAADFSQLISYSPRNDNYYINRGACFYNQKNYSTALADFEQAIALNPANSIGYYYISITYNGMKEYRKAYEFAAKAASMGFKVDQHYLEALKLKGV